MKWGEGGERKIRCLNPHNFELSDFKELAPLANLEAHFILSINDHPEMRVVFKAFNLKPANLTYSASKNECHKAHELIITNS